MYLSPFSILFPSILRSNAGSFTMDTPTWAAFNAPFSKLLIITSTGYGTESIQILHLPHRSSRPRTWECQVLHRSWPTKWTPFAMAKLEQIRTLSAPRLATVGYNLDLNSFPAPDRKQTWIIGRLKWKFCGYFLQLGSCDAERVLNREVVNSSSVCGEWYV